MGKFNRIMAAVIALPTAFARRERRFTMTSTLFLDCRISKGLVFAALLSVSAITPGARAHSTILSSDIGVPGNAPDNSHHVVTALAVDSSPIQNGFVVEDGNANASGTINPGGGIYIGQNANPSLRFCIVRNNSAVTDGGGTGCENAAFNATDTTGSGNACSLDHGGITTS